MSQYLSAAGSLQIARVAVLERDGRAVEPILLNQRASLRDSPFDASSRLRGAASFAGKLAPRQPGREKLPQGYLPTALIDTVA